MMQKSQACNLRIGDASFSVRWASEHILPDLYKPFLIDDVSADTVANYKVESQLPEARPAAGTIYWEGPSWRMASVDDGITIDVFNVFSQQWQVAAKMNCNFSNGTLYSWINSGPSASEVLQPPVDRVVFVNRLSIMKTVLLHASAVQTDAGVLLFCGRSCIGKSTIADIWEKYGKGKLLNDDRAIAFCRGGNVLAGAAPWHGKNPAVDPAPAPLRAIFHLGQAAENQISKLDHTVAVAKLLATSAVPFYYEPSVTAATDAVVEICSKVPSFELDFYPDKAVLDIVENVLADGELIEK